MRLMRKLVARWFSVRTIPLRGVGVGYLLIRNKCHNPRAQTTTYLLPLTNEPGFRIAKSTRVAVPFAASAVFDAHRGLI